MLMYGKAVQLEVNAIIDLTTFNCVAALPCEMLMSGEAVEQEVDAVVDVEKTEADGLEEDVDARG